MIIVFDFDGVILDSDLLKFDIFELLFRYEKKNIKNKILKYHFKNQGINRKVKFKHISKNILKLDNFKKKALELEKTFKVEFKKKIPSCKFSCGAINSLKFLNKSNIPCYIATGVHQKEINELISKLKIKKFFKNIYGYPKKKDEILRIIKKSENVKYSKIYFIGDSMSDFFAAKKRKVNFLGRRTILNHREKINNKYFREINVYKIIKKVYNLYHVHK